MKDYTQQHLKYFFSDEAGRQGTTYTPYDSEKQKKADNFTSCSETDQYGKENALIYLIEGSFNEKVLAREYLSTQK